MNTNSNTYVMGFAVAMCVTVSAVLATLETFAEAETAEGPEGKNAAEDGDDRPAGRLSPRRAYSSVCGGPSQR